MSSSADVVVGLPGAGRASSFRGRSPGSRPSTLAGRVNLAPFSFFNAFGANPPIVVFSPTLRRDGSKKDTLLNLEAVGEFVVNAAVEELAEKLNATSAELPRGQSEAEYAGLTLVPSTKVQPPRVAESPVHLECRVRQIMPMGDGPIAANLVIGEVVLIHIDERVLDATGQVDPRKLARDRPPGRRAIIAGRAISFRWSGPERLAYQFKLEYARTWPSQTSRPTNELRRKPSPRPCRRWLSGLPC